MVRSVKPAVAKETGPAKDVEVTDSYSPQVGSASLAPATEQAKVDSSRPLTPEETPASVQLSPQPTTSQAAAPTVLNTLEEPAPTSETPAAGPTFFEAIRNAANAVGSGIGSLFNNQLKPFKAELDNINTLEKMAQQLKTPEQFAAKTAEFKQRLANGESFDKLRPEAYAVAREAARQATKMRAYDCQVLGALAMDDGHIAEMRTGEGKTLTAVLPLYLNALAGKGAHLVTVNETLAKRDSEWMGPIFQRLGMTVGCVTEQQTPEQKRAGYNCDVTYVSDRALGFDFLRDRGVYNPADKVQRPPFFALVDEVDEVLLDEARTPMIISAKTDEPSSDYKIFNEVVKQLVPGDDFKVDEEKHTAWLTDGGLRFVENELVLMQAKAQMAAAPAGSPQATEARNTLEKATEMKGLLRQENALLKQKEDIDFVKPNLIARSLGMNGKYDREADKKVEGSLQDLSAKRESLAEEFTGINLYAEENTQHLSYLDACLKARTLFRRGKDYTVENGEVKIVDGNKGRVSEGKRYSRGLHQALEAKEGLEVKAETAAISKITMPELMAQYERKSGMTGTGKTSEAEFMESYGFDVIEIPTNKPVIRVDKPDVVFSSKQAKFDAVVERAIKEAQEGRPVLLGTISVNSNRELAARLLKEGWPSDRLQILNADTVRGGADNLDPDAGRSGAITLTTGDRAKLVTPDPYNYKKMAIQAGTLAGDGKPVLLDVATQKDADEVKAWLEGQVPTSVTKSPDASQPGVQIVVGREKPEALTGFTHLDSTQFKVDKPQVLKVNADNAEEVLGKALEAFTDGTPVILEAETSKQLSESASYLLDRGLGLNAIPMVCEGKEKENVMVEMAGRSGMITVATNMAGRGADIKPDLVAITHIAEAAYQKASQNKPTTITVDKDSQALKLQRLLQDHVPVTITDDPEKRAKDGEILVRYGKEMPSLEGEANLKGSDFKTKGLLVLGTERAPSKRIDNQLIGRSGRQGAEGESQFYLSLEDDVPRIFGGEGLEPILNLFGDGEKGLSAGPVNSLMEKAQERVENQHYDQRHNAGKYYDVHRSQREAWFGMRERLVNGEENPVEFVSDFTAQGVAQLIKERLGDKSKYHADEVNTVLDDLRAQLKVDLVLPDLPEKAKLETVEKMLYPKLEKLFSNPNLDTDKLRQAALQQIDLSWRDHLEEMEVLQDGIYLESYGGREPEKVFPERAFEVFQGTLEELKSQMTSVVLPAAARVQAASTSPKA